MMYATMEPMMNVIAVVQQVTLQIHLRSVAQSPRVELASVLQHHVIKTSICLVSDVRHAFRTQHVRVVKNLLNVIQVTIYQKTAAVVNQMNIPLL